MKAKAQPKYFNMSENFLRTSKYFEFLKKFSDCISHNKDISVVDEQEILSQLEIPSFLQDISVETGEPIQNIINMSLRYLSFDYNVGNFYKNRSILSLIKSCPSLPPEQKLSLLKYIFQNLNEGELYNDQERCD